MFITLLIILLSFPLTGSAVELAENHNPDNSLETWFNNDEELSTEHINEGELTFLNKPPSSPVLHSINRISISETSLITGWVLIDQCYENLDPVPVTEIVYQYKSIRGLQITTHDNIESATIDNNVIRLDTVRKNAKLCIKAEVKILQKNNNDTYTLTNGPFHRQFLDGFYPYHLTLQVNYPSTLLKLESSIPGEQTGFVIKRDVDMLYIDSLFEGKLTIKLLFKKMMANT